MFQIPQLFDAIEKKRITVNETLPYNTDSSHSLLENISLISDESSFIKVIHEIRYHIRAKVDFTLSPEIEQILKNFADKVTDIFAEQKRTRNDQNGEKISRSCPSPPLLQRVGESDELLYYYGTGSIGSYDAHVYTNKELDVVRLITICYYVSGSNPRWYNWVERVLNESKKVFQKDIFPQKVLFQEPYGSGEKIPVIDLVSNNATIRFIKSIGSGGMLDLDYTIVGDNTFPIDPDREVFRVLQKGEYFCLIGSINLTEKGGEIEVLNPVSVSKAHVQGMLKNDPFFNNYSRTEIDNKRWGCDKEGFKGYYYQLARL